MSIRQEVFEAIKEILNEYPEGLRYSDIVRKLKEKFKDTSTNTLHAQYGILGRRYLMDQKKT